MCEIHEMDECDAWFLIAANSDMDGMLASCEMRRVPKVQCARQFLWPRLSSRSAGQRCSDSGQQSPDPCAWSSQSDAEISWCSTGIMEA
jgi:hypothetical protein